MKSSYLELVVGVFVALGILCLAYLSIKVARREFFAGGGYEVQAVYFDVPLEVCLERNSRRHRVVEEDVMRRMAAKLKPPTFEEGFSKITVVRVKAKE